MKIIPREMPKLNRKLMNLLPKGGGHRHLRKYAVWNYKIFQLEYLIVNRPPQKKESLILLGINKYLLLLPLGF